MLEMQVSVGFAVSLNRPERSLQFNFSCSKRMFRNIRDSSVVDIRYIYVLVFLQSIASSRLMLHMIPGMKRDFTVLAGIILYSHIC